MPRATTTVAEVFRRYGDTFRAQAGAALATAQRRVMTAIEQCRTAALGGHIEQCDRCGHRRVWYNSCRNRHCPTCQSLARAAWLERRRADLLPTEYFHVVFTVPPAVAEVATQNKAVVYGLLFRSVAETLRTIAADPSAPRRRDRLLRRPPHLGSDARPSPASALRCSGRRARERRSRLGGMLVVDHLAGKCVSPAILDSSGRARRRPPGTPPQLPATGASRHAPSTPNHGRGTAFVAIATDQLQPRLSAYGPVAGIPAASPGHATPIAERQSSGSVQSILESPAR